MPVNCIAPSQSCRQFKPASALGLQFSLLDTNKLNNDRRRKVAGKLILTIARSIAISMLPSDLKEASSQHAHWSRRRNFSELPKALGFKMNKTSLAVCLEHNELMAETLLSDTMRQSNSLKRIRPNFLQFHPRPLTVRSAFDQLFYESNLIRNEVSQRAKRFWSGNLFRPLLRSFSMTH